MQKKHLVYLIGFVSVGLLFSIVYIESHGNRYQSKSPKAPENVVVVSAQSKQNTPVDNYEISDLKSELAFLKEQIFDLQAQMSSSDRQSTSSDLDRGVSTSIQEIYQMYMDDPDSFTERLSPYVSAYAQSASEQTTGFFNNLPDDDAAWSEQSQGYLNDAINDSSIQNLVIAQVNDSSCKSGVCKVNISLQSNNAEGFSAEERMHAEHYLLKSFAGQFPNSRLKMKEQGGQLVVEGYINDGSISLPSNNLDIQNPETIQEIYSILNQ